MPEVVPPRGLNFVCSVDPKNREWTQINTKRFVVRRSRSEFGIGSEERGGTELSGSESGIPRS